MTAWASRCGRAYREVARAFPRKFRLICGDGLEQLGADIVPLVWKEQGVVGLMRLFADLALRLPEEYFWTWTGKFKELTMTDDLFEGTWKARNDKSSWDPKYTPEQACMRFEATDTGYLLVAYGIKDGQACAERPTTITPDGRRRPTGLTSTRFSAGTCAASCVTLSSRPCGIQRAAAPGRRARRR